MKYQGLMVALALLAVLSGQCREAAAEMNASEKDVSVRKLGVSWNIASDRKMENIAGVYEPEGLDKYIKRYFDQLTEKVDELSMKVDQLSRKLDQSTEAHNVQEKKKDTTASYGGNPAASQGPRNVLL